MDYSTELITQLADQMTAAFKAAVAQHLETGGKALTIADVETGMRHLLRQIGRQSLTSFSALPRGRPSLTFLAPVAGKFTISGNGRRR